MRKHKRVKKGEIKNGCTKLMKKEEQTKQKKE